MNESDPTPPSTVPTERTFRGAALAAYRTAASALLTDAAGPAPGGRLTTDPKYRSVVEGRIAPKYSSCGDLAHWLFYRLGVRAPWINRAEFKAPAGHGWRVGWNLAFLTAGPDNAAAYAARKLTAVPKLDAGDVFLISNVYGGHAICVTAGEDQPDGSRLIHTAEYGQPGGLPKTHILTLHAATGLVFCGGNQVTHIVPLAAALALPGLDAPDLRGLADAVKAVFTAPPAPGTA